MELEAGSYRSYTLVKTGSLIVRAAQSCDKITAGIDPSRLSLWDSQAQNKPAPRHIHTSDLLIVAIQQIGKIERN